MTLVEGPSRKENAPVVDDSSKVEGSYAQASSSKATLTRIRELGAPKGTKTAEGFLFPATYELNGGLQRQRARRAAARRVRGELQAGRHELRQAQEPLALRRADHRVDDRARGAAGARALAGLGGHLQPAEGGYAPSRSTRRSATRRTIGNARSDSPSSTATSRTTRASTAGCRRRRSATPAWPRSRPPPSRPARTTCSTCASRASPASTRSPRPTRSSQRDLAKYQASREDG